MINRSCIVRWLFAAVIIFVFLPGSAAAQEKTSITVEWIYSEAGKNVASLPSFFWLDDGKLVLFDRQKFAQGFPAVAGAEPQQLLRRNGSLHFFVVGIKHADGVMAVLDSTIEHGLPDQLPLQLSGS